MDLIWSCNPLESSSTEDIPCLINVTYGALLFIMSGISGVRLSEKSSSRNITYVMFSDWAIATGVRSESRIFAGGLDMLIT